MADDSVMWQDAKDFVEMFWDRPSDDRNREQDANNDSEATRECIDAITRYYAHF